MPGFDILSKQLYSSRAPSDKCKVHKPPLHHVLYLRRIWDDRFKVLVLYPPKFTWKHLKHPKILTT
jgi:hypothetical protein